MATNALNKMRIAMLATDGVEQSELTEPKKALETAGARVEIVAPKSGKIQAWEHQDRGDEIEVHSTLDEAMESDYDALVLPGGVMNPDQLRTNSKAVQFVRKFTDQGKPVAAICHGPWTLIEADAVRGKNMTSWPSLKTDLTNAGAQWTDKSVIRDGNLVTSRKPSDIPDFNREMIRLFADQLRSPATNTAQGRETRRPSAAPSAQA